MKSNRFYTLLAGILAAGVFISSYSSDVMAADAPSTTNVKTAGELASELIDLYEVGDISGVMDLYADDIHITDHFEMPHSVIYDGKASILATDEVKGMDTGKTEKQPLPRMYENYKITKKEILQTNDPNIAVVTWTERSTVGAESVESTNVVIVRARDGKIVRTDDYHNKALRAVAMGQVEDFVQKLRSRRFKQDQ